MVRIVRHANEIERAFSGQPCADIEIIARVSAPWWVSHVDRLDDGVAFLEGLYVLPDMRA